MLRAIVIPVVGDASLVVRLPGEDFPPAVSIRRRDSAAAPGRDTRAEAEVCSHALAGVNLLGEA